MVLYFLWRISSLDGRCITAIKKNKTSIIILKFPAIVKYSGWSVSLSFRLCFVLHSPAVVKAFRMVGWLACPSPHLLAKSTNNLGHPILSLHSPAIVKAFRMVGWPVLPPTCLLKVRTIYATPPPYLEALEVTHSTNLVPGFVR